MDRTAALPAPARCLVFNGVGCTGFPLQLATLAALLGAGVHYLAATAVAVEAAVLHNFVWHQRWTWRDRPAGSLRSTLARLARFHLLNGGVSLAGNLALMAVLTGAMGVPPVLANVAAVVACSVVNFFASERLVFRAARRTIAAAVVLCGAAPALAAGADDRAVELRPATLAAWRVYERQVEERYQRLTAAGSPFFAHDEYGLPKWREAVRAGGLAMARLDTPAPRSARPSIPDGRVHHWVGAVFVRGVTVAEVVRRLQSGAGRESEFYDDVLASKLLRKDGTSLAVYLKLRRETFVTTVVYNTEHAVEYRLLGETRATSRSIATKIAELADAGTPREREKPAGADRGFLWKLNAYWRYEQADGGVVIECESISLSRGVPALLRPFIGGIVDGIARGALESTLTGLRNMLTKDGAPPGPGP